MTFLWPSALLLLVLIPFGVALDRAMGRRRRAALAAAGLASAAAAGTARAPSRRRLFRQRTPAAILLAGLVVMTLALARPQGVVSLPREEGTVILAFDVSGSMAATDLQPTRMAAAQAAATDFVKRQPDGVIVGVVAFSDGGISVQAPTRDQAAVLAAIDRLAPQRGTSLGQGIAVSLHTIDLVLNPPPTDYYSNRVPDPSPTPEPTPVPAGTHAPAAIVLLTDGENNEAPDPIAAAQVAADRGIRIHTIGIGSAAGTTLDLNGFQVHTQLNEPMLQQIADVTGGTYFHATDAGDLRSIYDSLDTQLVVKPEQIEVTGLFAGASVLLLAIGGLLSLGWLGRLP